MHCTCTVCLLPSRALGKLPARPQPHGFWSIHRWNCQWSHAKHWKENKETCLEGARRQVRRDSRRICLKESDESVSKHWNAQLRWIPVVCNLSQFPPINYLRTGGVRHHNLFLSYRRQLRSQTSDNMDRWKAEMGRVREKRRVEERRAEERRSEKRKSQKKEGAGARKGRKVAKHFVFPMICGSGGSKKVGSPKCRVRSHLARWEMKNCTPLWREAHLQVKKLKTPHVRTLLEVEMSKKCTPLWREAHFEVKMLKTQHVRPTFGSSDVEKCTPLWREAHFEVKMLKTPGVRTTFGGSDVVSRGRRKGLCTLSKVSKMWGFLWHFFPRAPAKGSS